MRLTSWRWCGVEIERVLASVGTLLYGMRFTMLFFYVGLVDMTMVAQLVWVVALAGVSLFVTTGQFDKTDMKKSDWLDHVNTFVLSAIGISFAKRLTRGHH